MVEIDGHSLIPKEKQMIDQYTRVVGKLHEMFMEMTKRTEWEVWRFDGVGSCGLPKELSEIGLSGIARERIIALREDRNRENNMERVQGKQACPYHRKDFGCVLGDLKSPVCISYMENKEEVWEKFGIDAAVFYKEVRSILDEILFAGVDNENSVRPELNDEPVDQFVGRIGDEIERIKTFPNDN